MARQTQPKCFNMKMDYVTIEIILIIIVILVAVYLIYKQNQNMKLERFSEHLPTLTMYYTNWCGHSKRMLPVFDGVKPRHLGAVNFIKLDCDDTTGGGKQQCSENRIKYLPTILFRKTPTSDPVKYTGGPDANILNNFVATQLSK